MIYKYLCTSCDHSFDLHTTIAKRDEPLLDPCKECGSPIRREVGAPRISHDGAMTVERRAGHEWKDRLNQIKKNCGRQSTIQAL